MTIKLTTNKGYAGQAHRTTYRVVVTKINERYIEGDFQIWNQYKFRHYGALCGPGAWYWRDIYKIEVISLA